MKIITFILSILLILFQFKLSYAQQIIDPSNYVISTSDASFFDNAYSKVTLSVSPKGNAKAVAFVALPSNIANDSHVQALFEKTAESSAQNITFDIYFPLFSGSTELPLRIYTEETDPASINDSTSYIPFKVQITGKKSGSSLMLYQENKERNVRVFQTKDSTPGNNTNNKSVEYFWIARNLKDPTEVIPNAIVHITELKNSTLLNSLILQQKSENSFSEVSINYDSINKNKAHLYLTTDSKGVAKLIVSPSTSTSGGQLIYWPFAANTSEAARIVVYNPNILGKDFYEPVIRKNPIIISDDNVCDIPTFDIENQNPKNITAGGRLYLLINDNYDNSIIAPDLNTITMTSTSRFINTSSFDLPQANDARYIYVSDDGIVSTSRKYSFFAYSGLSKTINRIDQSILNFCEIKKNKIYAFSSALKPENEIPPIQGNFSSGNIDAQYNMDTQTLNWNITYENLSDTNTGIPVSPTAAHFHGPASPSQKALPIITIPPAMLNSPIKGEQKLTPEQEQQLIKGLWYFNIHTNQNPDGVLRGQLTPG